VIEFAGRGLLLDIEGTTTSITFVYDTLFPYARRNLRAFLAQHAGDPQVREACELIAPGAADAQAIEREVLRRMDADEKSTGLKQLQGLIWRAGYAKGELRGHVYPDVPPAFAAWDVRGADIRIYSSGSVEAQRLLFANAEGGPLDRYLRGYYDTRTGAKRSAESYRRIANDMQREPGAILFFSDVAEELDAARAAGMATVLVRRGAGSAPASHPVIRTFDEVRLTGTGHL
jgi:enolase-phosphatase E1